MKSYPAPLKFVFVSGWFFALLMFVVLIREHDTRKYTEQKNDTLRTIVSQKIPQIIEQTNAIKDSSIKREKRDSLIASKKPVIDTAKILSRADTIKTNLRALVDKDYRTMLLKKNDTLNEIRKQYNILLAYNTQLKNYGHNIVFNSGKPKTPFDTLNASIYAIPFKTSSNKSIFSPQKNYLRIYNQNPIGTVNNSPYYDYEQTNDEINQFIIQARGSYNVTNNISQIGAGFELKLNRLGISAAGLINPLLPKQRTFVLGIREDIFNIRFK